VYEEDIAADTSRCGGGEVKEKEREAKKGGEE
jgi:hypothetical protein